MLARNCSPEVEEILVVMNQSENETLKRSLASSCPENFKLGLEEILPLSLYS